MWIIATTAAASRDPHNPRHSSGEGFLFDCVTGRYPASLNRFFSKIAFFDLLIQPPKNDLNNYNGEKDSAKCTKNANFFLNIPSLGGVIFYLSTK